MLLDNRCHFARLSAVISKRISAFERNTGELCLT